MASEKVLNLIEEVKNLTVLELSELVKALEEEFGVSASAPMAAAAAAPAAEAAAEEQLQGQQVPQRRAGEDAPPPDGSGPEGSRHRQDPR